MKCFLNLPPPSFVFFVPEEVELPEAPSLGFCVIEDRPESEAEAGGPEDFEMVVA